MPKTQAITDIPTLRERARQHIDLLVAFPDGAKGRGRSAA
jgi:hypothetical protein